MMGVLVTLQNGIELKYWSVTKLEYDLNASSQGWIYIQGEVRNRGYVYDKLHSNGEVDAVKTIELRAFKVSEYD